MDPIIDGDTLLIPIDSGSGQTGWHAIGLDAIASWGELLGTNTDAETVAAMLAATDPGLLDHESGTNAFTPAYTQTEHDRLADLNQVTAALIRPVDPVSGALVADGRAETRRLLGLDGDPTDRYERDAREAASQAIGPPAARMYAAGPEPAIRLPDTIDADRLAGLLDQHAPTIDRARNEFLQSITPTISKEHNQ